MSVVFSKTLRVWELDVQGRIIRPADCSMGQLKRIVKCIQVRTFFIEIFWDICFDEVTKTPENYG